MEPLPFDPDQLLQLANQRMPFGRYKGVALLDLPEPYVVWFKQQGFPAGQLGQSLAAIYEIKLNGLEPLIRRALARPNAAAPSRKPR